jgi:hypothetical protein
MLPVGSSRATGGLPEKPGRSSAEHRVWPALKPAETIHPAGQLESTLTLKLPVQRPDVAVPVVELFLAPAASP